MLTMTVTQTSFCRWLFLAMVFIPRVTMKNCIGVSSCICDMDDGSGRIDITSIGRTDGVPRFKDMAENPPSAWYRYNYNPCAPFTLGGTVGSCQGVASCETIVGNDNYFYSLGRDPAVWGYDSTSNMVTITYTDSFYKTIVSLKCDASATTPRLEILGMTGQDAYAYTLTSDKACPSSSGGGGTSDGGLSPGSVMCIILLVVLVVYVVGGVVFLHTARGATGAEMVPNRTFWMAIPGLIIDGCKWVIGKIRGGGGQYQKM
ncbi:uncharacterized protein LOC141912299 [Tubulanus polymorphus]|uniref:uncharacterized protein LOC141912299 n=1 Tax=Tubulanus polymorphus TaxID=672921 RepID=UPI003DA6078B